ncbi:MAG TPA: STAS domain-containing protein [Candidatus Angelobacter sp.]
MALKVTERQAAGVTILDFSGRIVLGKQTALMRDAIQDQVARGRKYILLNLGEVSHIDSTAIGELVGALRAVRREGGDLKLLNLTRRVRDMVEVVKLGTIFELFEDESAALKSFAGEHKQEPGPVARAS